LTFKSGPAPEGVETARRLSGSRAAASPTTRRVVDFFMDFP
jgi:hypothetical protein